MDFALRYFGSFPNTQKRIDLKGGVIGGTPLKALLISTIGSPHGYSVRL
jgi:hypothetical protein